MPTPIPFDVEGNIQRLHEWAKRNKIRIALTPKTHALGCRGCNDGENIRHHKNRSLPIRCEYCPAKTKNSSTN